MRRTNALRVYIMDGLYSFGLIKWNLWSVGARARKRQERTYMMKIELLVRSFAKYTMSSSNSEMQGSAAMIRVMCSKR